MSEYISREELLKHQYRIDDSASLSTRDVVNVEDIEDCSSADVRPNIHGHWKPVDPLQSGDNERYGTYICSVCGTGTYGIVPARWKGCPWCLAIMDGEPKGEKGTE